MLELVLGDLTEQRVDAIVNAANSSLLGGGEGEPDLLAACHRRALEVAAELGCRTVAFPAISTGVYGYPVELAAPVAIAAAQAAVAPPVELVRFVLFGEAHLNEFTRALQAFRVAEHPSNE